ncbi:MAG TPA: TraB/GumN family protein [Stellaceae bacterium]|nr:TraB/GumN family protein [Stellaceae bacterium]
MWRGFFAATGVAAALLTRSVAAEAAPGLWVAKDGNSAVYLFGTVHIIEKGLDWQSPAIAQAFAASSKLWLEVPNPDDQQSAQGLIRAYGFDRAHPLSTKLSPQDRAKVDAAVKAAQLPQGEAALEPMSPWLAALTLDDALLVHSGYDPKSGVEHVLLQQAAKQQKPVFGFETLDQQVRLFADLKPQLQIQMLENSLDGFEKGPAELKDMVDAWMKDDQAALTRDIVDEIKTPLPALYQVLIVARNENWAGQIATMLKKPGVRFVAVGAGHLTGPDSVQAKLEQRGIQVEAVSGAAQMPSSGR